MVTFKVVPPTRPIADVDMVEYIPREVVEFAFGKIPETNWDAFELTDEQRALIQAAVIRETEGKMGNFSNTLSAMAGNLEKKVEEVCEVPPKKE
jgi:hypothetical protein